MVVRATNQDEDFYPYIGKFFGSRVVERQTNDRLYDDNDKLWYIYLDGKKPMAFVSVAKNMIKNVYTIREEYLEEILERVKKENKITYSIVTNAYVDVYERCGFKIDTSHSYKNFVTIYLSK